MAELHPIGALPTSNSPAQRGTHAALGSIAGALIVVLTIVSLWLSYEHLHDVGAAHGFAGDSWRAWAWPATLDCFYATGEVLILRAALAHRVDWWAILLLVFGAGGSIALNIAGVGPDADALDYVVAAVPPVASLLAFGALMSQIFRHLAGATATAPVTVPPPPLTAPVEPADAPTPAVTEPPAPAWIGTIPVSARLLPTATPCGTAPRPPQASARPVYADARCAVIRPLYDGGTRPGTKAMRAALEAAGYGPLSDGTLRGTIRGEIERLEPYLEAFPPAPVAITA